MIEITFFGKEGTIKAHNFTFDGHRAKAIYRRKGDEWVLDTILTKHVDYVRIVDPTKGDTNERPETAES